MSVEDPDPGAGAPPEGGSGGDAPPSAPPVEQAAESTPPPAPVEAPKPVSAGDGDPSDIAKALNRQNEIFEAQSKSLKRIEEALYEDPEEPHDPTGSPDDAEVSIVAPDPPPQPHQDAPGLPANEPAAQGKRGWKRGW